MSPEIDPIARAWPLLEMVNRDFQANLDRTYKGYELNLDYVHRMVASVDTQIQPLIDTAKPAIN